VTSPCPLQRGRRVAREKIATSNEENVVRVFRPAVVVS